jgi:putative hydrolase of the HAD superfamily
LRFNRRIQKIKAISFDLDDTLYSNREVMVATDAAMTVHFSDLFNHRVVQHQSKITEQQYSAQFWFSIRQQILLQFPDLKHDVTEIRRIVYLTGLLNLGFEKESATLEANNAMAVFHENRNKVIIDDAIHQFLSDLSSRYPLIAISNGNVDTKKIGLSQYFQATYHAGNGFKQKPNSDLFHHACQHLNIETKHLLHIGDCGKSDIKGALRAGCQSAWLNCYDVGKPITSLPDIELNNVTDIAKFL